MRESDGGEGSKLELSKEKLPWWVWVYKSAVMVIKCLDRIQYKVPPDFREKNNLGTTDGSCRVFFIFKTTPCMLSVGVFPLVRVFGYCFWWLDCALPFSTCVNNITSYPVWKILREHIELWGHSGKQTAMSLPSWNPSLVKHEQQKSKNYASVKLQWEGRTGLCDNGQEEEHLGQVQRLG